LDEAKRRGCPRQARAWRLPTRYPEPSFCPKNA